MANKFEEIKAKTADGRFFGVIFVKGDGTIRSMAARRGVHVGETGRGMAYDPDEREELSVYDLHARGYRTIRAESVLELTAHGETVDYRGDI